MTQSWLSAYLQNESMSVASSPSSTSSNFVELSVSELNRMNIAFQDQNPDHYICLSLGEATEAGERQTEHRVGNWSQQFHMWRWIPLCQTIPSKYFYTVLKQEGFYKKSEYILSVLFSDVVTFLWDSKLENNWFTSCNIIFIYLGNIIQKWYCGMDYLPYTYTVFK